ncbi:tryptophan-rich sensory protein [Sphingomonas sp. MMSM24]|uniref:Tryptophan-rich sensory protein n=2 Tax=Sphingomonas lycopersici TaxID=2951807 RepID=A0AA42CPF9_9SPHN|nr:tryptophan-rich sensory protein [Sphingomonas lycopersici]
MQTALLVFNGAPQSANVSEGQSVRFHPMDRTEKSAEPAWLRAARASIPVIAASLLGQWATWLNLAPWYAGLLKPSFNPPDWIFAPVWTSLYVLMAYSVWRILKVPARRIERRIALTLFFAQLVLNASWPWLFFGLNSPLAGLANIVPQFVVIIATIDRFRRLDLVAARCLMPLAAWVAFASLLNFEIWRLNG